MEAASRLRGLLEMRQDRKTARTHAGRAGAVGRHAGVLQPWPHQLAGLAGQDHHPRLRDPACHEPGLSWVGTHKKT